MAITKTKLQKRIESGEIIEQKCWKFIKELNSAGDERLDAVALIDSRRSYTYRQMFRKWERYAEVFTALNMTGAKHARVGLLSEISANAIFAFYALNMTGASVSMLPQADLSAKEHCANMIKTERLTDLVLCDTKLNPEILSWLARSREELGLGSIVVMHVPVEGQFVAPELGMFYRPLTQQLRQINGVLFMDQLLTQYEATPISYARGLADDAAIIHTSGTTSGIHKPVPLSDRGLNEAAARLRRDPHFAEFEGNAVTALLTDLSSSYMLADVTHLPFAFGGTVIALPMGFFNPRFFDALVHYRANLMFTTPALLENLAKTPIRLDLSNFSFIFVGGSPVSVDAKRRINETIRRYGGSVGITIGYGLSELGGACILSDPDRADNAIGYPLSGVTVKIFDESDGKFHDLSDGERTGTLYLSSASVSCGRLDDHEFFPLDEIDGKPFYNTYDLVTVAADGSMTYAGRTNKFFVNNEGIRFDAGLVETAIGGQPGIAQCGLAPEYTKLIHDTVPVLYVRTAAGSGDPVMTVRNALIGVFIRENNITKTNLPGQCVIADELPLTDLGKVDVHRIVNGEVAGTRYKIQPVRVNGALKDIVLTPALFPDTPLWSSVPEELEELSGGIFTQLNRMMPGFDMGQYAQKPNPSGGAQTHPGSTFEEGMKMFMNAISNPFAQALLFRPGFGLDKLAVIGCAAVYAMGYAQGMAGQAGPVQGFGCNPGAMPQMPGAPGQPGPMQGFGCNQSTMPQMPGTPGAQGQANPMQGFGCNQGTMPQMPQMPGMPGAPGQPNPMQGFGCNQGAMPQMPGTPGAPGQPNPMQGFGCAQGAMPQMPGMQGRANPMQGFGCAQANPAQNAQPAGGGAAAPGGQPSGKGFDPMQAMGMLSRCFNASTSSEFYED